ncbi:hypothetical protein J437_LFUL002304 [Ladona fulva]|uniref:Uncharacterized protein n=1 Tax=Ladona fulva TaxID=123851 RepID=A0A8K0NWF2_LADFU|nr:hypothetical protein J437_LFUL002304 [Ladona fulva]
MASSQLINNTGGDGASSSLIIPKIPSESKRRELTDAIHHCFKLMLENNLAVPTISRETSMLAKLIGQEIFFRIVKMIYEIQFNVSKEVHPRRADKGKTVSAPASTGEIIDGIRVKREPPSPPSLMEHVRAAELVPDESIRTRGENRVEASSALAPTEEVLEESRIKNEPPSPPALYISFKDRDSSYSSSDDERPRPPLPFSIKERVRAAELNPDQSIITEGESMVEASSALGPTEESRIRSEPPSPTSPMVEESDMSSDDGDSTYSPSEDENLRLLIPFSVKVRHTMQMETAVKPS